MSRPLNLGLRALFCLALACTGSAVAQPAGGKPGTSPAASKPSTSPVADAPDDASCISRQNALSALGCELHAQLGALRGALVIGGGVQAEPSLERSAALAERATRVIAGALGGTAHPSQTTRGGAQLAARSASSLVYLEFSIGHGQLSVTADVYRPAKGFWARVRQPNPEPLRHAFAARPLDAEVRSFMPSVPLVAGNILKVKAPESDLLALGCGDVDGDSNLELIAVGRGAIHLGRIRSGAFVASARRSWSALSPIAAAPLREPIANVSLRAGRFVDVGITDRARGLRLNARLEPLATLDAPMPWPGNGCVDVYQTLLGRRERPCTSSDAPSIAPQYDYRGDAIAGASIVDRAGALQQYRALRAAKEHHVDLHSSRGGRARVEGLGAQLAMGDLDGDGAPELLASTPSLNPSTDALLIYTWREPAAPVERLRIAAAGGVSAISTCPAEDNGRALVVAAVGGELWLIR